ncbi:SurA N-terminal domain-containing protein [Serinicoccus marinus]|uniref:SurA N-terminal domain-containing protein n=1 Tax=Serinicoccus marinus TaxID=247333 RepID=UPI0003B67236|nr:SurA N-terminal domain-containing protein [Serinicoccus marinus]
MSARRKLATISLGLTLSLAGLTACSTDGGGDGDAAAASSSSPAPDDAASSSAAPELPEAMPEPDLSEVPDPVATVNGEDVAKDEFATYYESQFASAAGQAQMSGEELDTEQLQADTLDTVVDSVVLRQAAEEAGLEPSDEEVDTLLEELATGNGLESVDQFLEVLEQQGMDEETARREAASQLAIQAYIEEEAQVEDPSDEELRDYYDELVAQQEEAAPEGESGASGTAAPQPEIPEFDEVKDQLAEQLRAEEQAAATDELIAALREDAEITSHL